MLDDIGVYVLDVCDALVNGDGFKVEKSSKDKRFRVKVCKIVSI